MPEAYIAGADGLTKIDLKMGALTEDEQQIILDGCLINYNRQE